MQRGQELNNVRCFCDNDDPLSDEFYCILADKTTEMLPTTTAKSSSTEINDGKGSTEGNGNEDSTDIIIVVVVLIVVIIIIAVLIWLYYNRKRKIEAEDNRDKMKDEMINPEEQTANPQTMAELTTTTM